MNTQNKCDDVALALYCSGHLDETEMKTMENHLSECRYCTDDLNEMKKIKETLPEKFLFETVTRSHEYIRIVEKIENKVSGNAMAGIWHTVKRLFRSWRGKGSSKFSFPVIWRLLPVSTAFIIIMVTLISFHVENRKNDHRLISKGISSEDEPSVKIFYKQGDEFIGYRKKQCYEPGETIQFVYSSKDFGFLILLSIDEKGNLTTLFPNQGDSSAVIKKSETAATPKAFRLDSYIGKEMYIALFSKERLSVHDQREHVLALYAKKHSLEDIIIKPADTVFARTILTTKVKKVE